MFAAASGVLLTGVQDHRADVPECPPAELAGEIAGKVSVERLVVATVRMMVASVPEKRRRIPVFLSAVFAVLAHVI